MPTITPIYASLIAIVFLILSFRVIFYRRSNKLGLGDEGDKSLLKRMRAQADCAEYAPLALILLLLVELSGTSGDVVHALGVALLAGRIIHGYAFSVSPPIMKGRVYGTILTTGMMAASAVLLLVQSVI